MKIWFTLIIVACSQVAVAEDLVTIYQQALQADPQLKSADEKIEVGAARKGQALGQMLPQVTASGNWSKIRSASGFPTSATHPAGNHDNISHYPGTRYTISLSQTLIDFEKFWEWRHASKTEDQYASEAIEAHNLLMFNVVDRYFTELEAEDQLNFTKSEKLATQKQLEQIQKQYDKQLMKVTDLYAMEARLDQVIAEEILAESKLVTAQEGLRELTGVSPSQLNMLRNNIVYPEIEGDLQQWLEVAQTQNPGISAKQIAIQASEDNVAAQKSRYLPVAELQLTYYDTTTGYQSSQISGSGVRTGVAAINVNVPLFSGGTTTHQLFEAQHTLKISKNDNEAAIRAIIKETSDAFLTTNANARHIKASQKALESAAKSREAMERGYHFKVVTISDVIKAQQEEFSAKKDFAQAKYNYIKNRIRFLRALGSIAEENLEEVNGWLEAKKP
jgi:outer membrane protein